MNVPVDVTNIRIETERLALRAWRESDLHDFYEYASVPGVGEKAGWNHHQSLDESQKILGIFINGKKTLALVLKENGKVIGSIGLEPRAEDAGLDEQLKGREIGYVLSKDYWGRGLMPEAVKAVVDYCFNVLDFDYLTCGHFDHNDRSRRVVEKSGFQFLKNVVTPTVRGIDEPGKLYVLYNVKKIRRTMTAPIDVTGVRLETERMILRPWQPEDLEDFYVYTSDKAVAPGMGWRRVENLEAARMTFQDYMADKESFALVLKETGSVIGDISVQSRPWEMYPIDRDLKGRELGFGISCPYWGRGLMPEAVQAVLEYCFRTLGYDFVTCGHFLGNDRSDRVIHKCGFTHLFDAVHTIPSTGKTHDITTFILYNPYKER